MNHDINSFLFPKYRLFPHQLVHQITPHLLGIAFALAQNHLQLSGTMSEAPSTANCVQ